jgi:uncharacterized protein (DUF1015 family)
MAIVKPFKGLRPPQNIVEKVACLPYDVMNSIEAAQMATGKPESLLHITRAEIDFDTEMDPHDEEVYQKAHDNYFSFIDQVILVDDEEPKFYVYAQTMNGKTQYGIVGAAACADYDNGIIKKHELTRPDKEEDRKVLMRKVQANLEPVFFTYRAVPELDEIVNNTIKNQPIYDFVAEDGFGHHFWVIDNPETNQKIETLFRDKVPYTYVADGHHRTAAAAGLGAEFAAKNPNHTGNEAYNYFMGVHFPDNQLQIIDYNRVVKDLNGHSHEAFIEKIKSDFDIVSESNEILKAQKLHQFSMYLDGKWYLLNAKNHTFDDTKPMESLDVTVLSKYVLEPILNIKDLRTSTRIDFVGGIRGLGELQKRVDSGEMAVAFALFPVSMKQLMDIADSGNIMPPKVTWFEPKLRSGLVIHRFDK